MRFPIRSGTGEPSLSNPEQARGSGEVDGGVVVRTLTGQYTVTHLRPALDSELVSATYEVNGVESSGQSLLRCGSDGRTIIADPVPAGQPQTIRVENVPLRQTQKALEAFTEALGKPPLGLDTILGRATAEAVYNPPQP